MVVNILASIIDVTNSRPCHIIYFYIIKGLETGRDKAFLALCLNMKGLKFANLFVFSRLGDFNFTSSLNKTSKNKIHMIVFKIIPFSLLSFFLYILHEIKNA